MLNEAGAKLRIALFVGILFRMLSVGHRLFYLVSTMPDPDVGSECRTIRHVCGGGIVDFPSRCRFQATQLSFAERV
jgi:hypothetical protein